MREHHLRLLGRYYRQIEAGRKTLEVRVATPSKAAIHAGDALIFHDRDSERELDVLVQRSTFYPTFKDLLQAEDAARIDPDNPVEQLLTTLRAIYPPAKESLGVLAFAFDHRPARPGHVMPLTPAQYAHTVPHHTVSACLYVRDAQDRLIQLRSVYGRRAWQFPGGNLDADGEDPLATARRETLEETGLGLSLAQEQPRLLLAHYLHVGPRRPLQKVEFVFDGGRLTADQLKRIRLDPLEHDLWAVHDLAQWRRLMDQRSFARLEAVERARRGRGPAYLTTPV
ncbi:NUDIX domain-containing protein [Streptomyces sp. NPDC016845]|uniref:NUDIX domain-containing protein n=1 Tax=Streptomyces sp. NPDC016845 TaxID=3364972 RepID=UPI00379E2797